MEISPAPTDEEAVAIAAAVHLLWPTPSAGTARVDAANDAAWRFSRRWWAAGSRSATWGTQPH